MDDARPAPIGRRTAHASIARVILVAATVTSSSVETENLSWTVTAAPSAAVQLSGIRPSVVAPIIPRLGGTQKPRPGGASVPVAHPAGRTAHESLPPPPNRCRPHSRDSSISHHATSSSATSPRSNPPRNHPSRHNHVRPDSVAAAPVAWVVSDGRWPPSWCCRSCSSSSRTRV